jgi:Pyridoxamine 5'-phosphate oxidase
MDDARAAFVEGGRSIVIATLGDDGLPMGSRVWGAAVVARQPTRLRLVVDPDDAATMANLRQGAAIAVTISDVRTLVSLQLKGQVVRVEAATDADQEIRRRYCDEFLSEIHDTDGEPLDKLERWADAPAAACVIEVHELFDQTPGPLAGNRIAGDA